MKKYQLYQIKEILKNIVDKPFQTSLSKKFLLSCIKNLKIIQNQIEDYQKLFDLNKIQGYAQYTIRQKELTEKFIQQHKQQIDKQQNLEQLQAQLKLQISKLRQSQYLPLFQKIMQLQKQRIALLNQNYDYASMCKINFQDLPDSIDNNIKRLITLCSQIIQMD